jgi:hypothetical protein
LFAAIVIICKCCVTDNANLSALGGREFGFLPGNSNRYAAIRDS